MNIKVLFECRTITMISFIQIIFTCTTKNNIPNFFFYSLYHEHVTSSRYWLSSRLAPSNRTTLSRYPFAISIEMKRNIWALFLYAFFWKAFLMWLDADRWTSRPWPECTASVRNGQCTSTDWCPPARWRSASCRERRRSSSCTPWSAGAALPRSGHHLFHILYAFYILFNFTC